TLRVWRGLPERDLGEKNVSAGREIEAFDQDRAFPDLHRPCRRACEARCGAVGSCRSLRALRPLHALRAGSAVGTWKSLRTLRAVSAVGTWKSLRPLGAIRALAT